MFYERYSREVLVKKAEYERQLRRSNKVMSPLSSEEKESLDLEWDLLVLNSPSKQVSKRKSIVEQLTVVDDEDSVLKTPSKRNSMALKNHGFEGSVGYKLRSQSGRLKSFAERLKEVEDDDDDELAES